MDLATILALVGTCLTIIARAENIVERLYGLRRKLKNTTQSIDSVITQVSAIESAVQGLTTWLETTSTASQEERCILRDSLEACASVIIQLDILLARICSRGDKPLLPGRVRFVWDEKTIKEHRGALQSQIQALSFLLQIMQLFVFRNNKAH